MAGCGAASGPGAAASATPTPGSTATATPTPIAAAGHLRAMAANLSSGTNQNWSGGEGMRILRGIGADVVFLQEFNYKTNSATDLRAFVDSALGPDFAFSRESGAQIPNGVISRFPILASGTWADAQVSNRGFQWAHLDVPGSVDLWVVSVHLLTSSESARDLEAHEIVSKIQATVPAGDYVIVGGDLNTATRTEACLTTFGAIVEGTAVAPADRAGNDNTNGPRSRPHDWVMASSLLMAHEAPTVIGSSTFAHGLVADTRVYDPIGEISPALAGDSGATGMQHMGVVRDFELP